MRRREGSGWCCGWIDYRLIIRTSPAREAREARPSARARADDGDGDARGRGAGRAVARGLTFECRLCAVLMCGPTAIRQPRSRRRPTCAAFDWAKTATLDRASKTSEHPGPFPIPTGREFVFGKCISGYN